MTSAVSGDSIKTQEGRFNPSPEWQFNASAHINTFFSMTFTKMEEASLFVTPLSGRKEKLQYKNDETVQEQNSSFVPSMPVKGYLVVCE